MAEILNTYWIVDGLDGGMGSDGIIAQSETAIIEFDSVVNDIPAAIFFSQFRGGQQHRSASNLFITGEISVTVQAESNGTTWEFGINYESRVFNQNSPDDVDYRPKVAYSKWSYPRTVAFDKETNLPILLPTGEAYEPSLTVAVSATIIHVTVRENSANANRIPLIGSVNNTQISIAGTTIPKFCGMIDDYQTEPFWDEEGFLTFFNTTSIKTKFFKNKSGELIGFKLEALAASFNQLVEDELLEITVKSITTPANPSADPPVAEVSEQVPVAEPQLIDELGVQTTEAFYQEWMPFDLISFGQFGLPTSYPAN